MPSLKAIRRRIASVKSTQKITKAMKMVAAARLRRAQQAILALRPYAKKTAEVLAAVAAGNTETDEEKVHPLLAPRPEIKTVAVVVLTSDRGLCGAFNSSITRGVDRKLRELEESGITDVQLVTIGRKGRDYFRRRNIPLLHDFTGAYEGGAARAAEIARQLMEDYKEKKIDRVFIAYNEFKSAISQKLIIDQLLPIVTETPSEDAAATATTTREYIFEPDRTALLERLLPMYVEVTLYRAMLESVASEHGARMSAMDSATTNAKKMIGSLTLTYNRARQAAITKELMEIIGGAEALKD